LSRDVKFSIPPRLVMPAFWQYRPVKLAACVVDTGAVAGWFSIWFAHACRAGSANVTSAAFAGEARRREPAIVADRITADAMVRDRFTVSLSGGEPRMGSTNRGCGARRSDSAAIRLVVDLCHFRESGGGIS
jgi:hypothetical protein